MVQTAAGGLVLALGVRREDLIKPNIAMGAARAPKFRELGKTWYLRSAMQKILHRAGRYGKSHIGLGTVPQESPAV